MSDYLESPCVEFDGGCVVVRVCTACGRFVSKKNIRVFVNGLDDTKVEAECAKCGPFKAEWGYP